MGDKTLKQQQCAWAIAWQDHGDRRALAALCHSMEGMVLWYAKKRALNEDMRADMESACRLAIMECVGKFDRTRPDGFSGLCSFAMRDHCRVVLQHHHSPASQPIQGVRAQGRVQIRIEGGDAEDGGGVSLGAEEVESVAMWEDAYALFYEADLTAREWRVLRRYKNGESLNQVGDLWGVTGEAVRIVEIGALAKVRAVAEQKGLELRDLL